MDIQQEAELLKQGINLTAYFQSFLDSPFFSILV